MINGRTRVMGILNVTNDSFSDDGLYMDTDRAVKKAMEMAEEGVDIIDIGGESSRPGSKPVSEEEELDRVVPVIKALRGRVHVPLSVDTYKSAVAYAAFREGASIVNDITALSDPAMGSTVAKFNAGVILMHMQGTPGTMQVEPCYKDVVGEIIAYLSGRIRLAENAGIDPSKIIVDPGIGFGKTLEHNLIVLRSLMKIKTALQKPVLIGTSRKSFIGTITGRDVSDRIFGTASSVALAIMNGADIVRVHDVRAMRDVSRVADAITG